MKEYNKKDAKFYGNIFAKMSKLEQLESNVSIWFLVDLRESSPIVVLSGLHRVALSFHLFVGYHSLDNQA